MEEHMVESPRTSPRKYPLVCLPIYMGGISPDLFNCLARATGECTSRGWEPPRVMFRTMDSVITRARNAMVAAFLQDPAYADCTDLVFIDGDITWDPGVFPRLLEHSVDLVAGVYCARGGEERYVFRTLENECIVSQEPETEGLIEVMGVGTGFFRVTRACLLRMMEAYGDRWYEDATAPNLQVPCLFDFEYESFKDRPGGIYYSEDYTFCRRWRALGGRVWVDPQLTLHHRGEQAFSGHLLRYLNRQYMDVMAKMDTIPRAKALLDNPLITIRATNGSALPIEGRAQ